jgi:lysophospholipase L1-like esterase
MTDIAVALCAVGGGFAAVCAWFAAIRGHGNTERLQLVVLAVLGVTIIGLTFLINDVANKAAAVGDVRRNQDCIIAMLRTHADEPGNQLRDAQLNARGCPTPPPFAP